MEGASVSHGGEPLIANPADRSGYTRPTRVSTRPARTTDPIAPPTRPTRPTTGTTTQPTSGGRSRPGRPSTTTPSTPPPTTPSNNPPATNTETQSLANTDSGFGSDLACHIIADDFTLFELDTINKDSGAYEKNGYKFNFCQYLSGGKYFAEYNGKALTGSDYIPSKTGL